MRVLARLVALLLVAAVPAAAQTVATPSAAELGGRLTPLGAERAGNADGTIPAWDGGITEPPPGYRPGHWHVDPYADDAVRYVVTAANLEQHAALLSPGQQALLRAYPDTWRVPVYPTHRSASYPRFVYEAARQNAETARLVVEGKGGVADSRITSPFPIPSNGLEALWNHLLSWQGIYSERANGSVAVTRRGAYRVLQTLQEEASPYGAPAAEAFHEKYPNLLLAIKQKVIAPSRRVGEGVLILEPVDQTGDPRKVWQYSLELRRVVRNPYAAYDFTAFDSEGLVTIDDLRLFNGSPDRFEWTLQGKRELLIPYNSYRLHSGELEYGDILRKGHINAEYTRYERHRVWVVEGRLREGQDHVYSRRVLYLDEDSWQATVAEAYDREGRLWRVSESHTVNQYEVPIHTRTLVVYHDLKERRYFATGLDNERRPPRYGDGVDPREFSPNALSYYVR